MQIPSNSFCPPSLMAFICISGKRKSGKDFLTRKLASAIENHFPNFVVSICTLSDPLKEEFARFHGVDAAQLKGDGPEKEVVRREMVEFGEKLRSKDSAYFCRKAFARRLAVSGGSAGPVSSVDNEVVLVSDCRRPSDVSFFHSHFPASVVLCLRVFCSRTTRQKRGFVFKNGIDDADSECALDGANWDFVVENEEEGQGKKGLEEQIEEVMTELERKLATTTDC